MAMLAARTHVGSTGRQSCLQEVHSYAMQLCGRAEYVGSTASATLRHCGTIPASAAGVAGCLDWILPCQVGFLGSLLRWEPLLPLNRIPLPATTWRRWPWTVIRGPPSCRRGFFARGAPRKPSPPLPSPATRQHPCPAFTARACTVTFLDPLPVLKKTIGWRPTQERASYA